MVKKQYEKPFMASIKRTAVMFGWLFYHTYNSRRSSPGFPDCVLVRPPRVIFAELKVGKNKLSKAQEAWILFLRQCPSVETYVWYPEDMEQIVEILKPVQRHQWKS